MMVVFTHKCHTICNDNIIPNLIITFNLRKFPNIKIITNINRMLSIHIDKPTEIWIFPKGKPSPLYKNQVKESHFADLMQHTIFHILTTFMPINLAHYYTTVSYTHLRAHETRHDLVCRLLLEKKKKKYEIRKKKKHTRKTDEVQRIRMQHD